MRHHHSPRTSAAALRASEWLDAAGLPGIALLFLLLHGSLLLGVALLIIGVHLWNAWCFLAGLATLQLFTWLHRVGRRFFSGG